MEAFIQIVKLMIHELKVHYKDKNIQKFVNTAV